MSWYYLESEILFVSPVNQLVNLLVIKVSDKNTNYQSPQKVKSCQK